MLNVKEWLGGFLSETTAQITDEAIEGIGTRASWLIAGISDAIDKFLAGITEMVKPGFDTFETYLGGILKLSILNGCKIFGFGLLLLFVSIYVIQYLMHPQNMKTTPFKLCGRVIIAAVLITGPQGIIDAICYMMAEMQAKIYTTSFGSFSFSNILFCDTTDFTILGLSISCLTVPPLNALFMIIVILVSWPVIKNLFRYILEMLERYIISCLLLLFFPAVSPLLILDETSTVFASYIRMLGGQLFLLVTSCIFLKGAVILIVGTKIVENGILGYLFLLGYLRIIQRIDYYLQCMGLNVAQATGCIMDSLGGAVNGIANGFRAANGSRKSAGNVLQAVGAHTGNQDMFGLGVMASSDFKSVAKNGLPTQENINKQFAEAAAKSGTNNINMDGAASGKMLSEFMQNPRTNKDILSRLSDESKENGLSHLTGMSDISNISESRNGAISFTAPDADGNSCDYTLSASPTEHSIPIYNEDHEPTGLHLDSQSSLGSDESIVGSADAVMVQSGSMDLGDKTDLSEDAVSSITTATSSGKDISFQDSDGNIVAMKDQKGNYVQPSAISNDGSISITDANTMRQDIQNMYPGCDIRKTENSVGGIQYDSTSKQAYAEVKVKGDAGWHKVYVQDPVTKDTSIPKDVNKGKTYIHKSNGGKHITKRYYAMDNNAQRSEKK